MSEPENTFKVGDKIKVYGFAESSSTKGSVMFLGTQIYSIVALDGHRVSIEIPVSCKIFDVHYRQCELIEKAKVKKRYWLWSIKGSNGWQSWDFYMDENGVRTSGYEQFVAFKTLDKIKHENEFIDVEVSE